MGSFDSSLWRERAWGRFRAALGDSHRNDEAEARWAQEVLAINDLEKIVGWCAERGIIVNFGKKQNGMYDQNTKTITISSHALPGRQLVYLLHECGHHLVGNEDHGGRFSPGYAMGHDPRATRTFKHKLACLEEEMEAWHRGWKLAVRLGLSLTREGFDEIRVECLRSYVVWANPGRKKEK